MLLTLHSHLPNRHQKAPIRVYWPKGRTATGVSTADTRALLPRGIIQSATTAIDAELLHRFESKPRFVEAIIDEALREIPVPFNERTASRSAVSLPRGARIQVPKGKLLRLFLHWCEPEKDGQTTDLDLSVGFYDEAWKYLGVCSYYQLEHRSSEGTIIARSAVDLTSAPWPNGATELVDVHREQALAAGIRYAVMVVNNYYGMPFSLLERAFAGYMLRDEAEGAHFDPRTVQMKFAVQGENGIFLPLVLDVRENVIHWLDVQAKGALAMNNVQTSNYDIQKICPELMTYFSSGVRPSMFELGLLHTAARADRVLVRGATIAQFVRRRDESVGAFYTRLLRGEVDEPRTRPPRADGPPVLALLYRGDLALPNDSVTYAVLREQMTPSLAASDLVS